MIKPAFTVDLIVHFHNNVPPYNLCLHSAALPAAGCDLPAKWGLTGCEARSQLWCHSVGNTVYEHDYIRVQNDCFLFFKSLKASASGCPWWQLNWRVVTLICRPESVLSTFSLFHTEASSNSHSCLITYRFPTTILSDIVGSSWNLLCRPP